MRQGDLSKHNNPKLSGNPPENAEKAHKSKPVPLAKKAFAGGTGFATLQIAAI